SDRRWPGRMLVIVSLGLAGLWGSFFDLRYSSDPQSAPLDTADRWQYTQSWTAAYALNPLLDEIRQIAADQGPITLILHDQSRLASLAGLIYLEREPDIEIVVIDMSRIDAPEQITALDHHKPTYLLADSQVVETYRLHTRFPMLVPLQAEANPGGEISFWLFQL
ncbi:MAG: hypothetical protein HGA19_12070, partial [Oscillochloris sp.]|nr:hypothetical protein [Oscillochloris sp.]